MQENSPATPANEIAVLLEAEQNLPAAFKKTLQEQFDPFLTQAKEWLTKAQGLKITSIDQVEEMAQSRTARLAMVKVRTGIDALRKKLNAPDMQQIKLRNSIAEALTDMVAPVEAILQANEDFAETETKRINEEKRQARLKRLEPFGTNTQFFDLATMDDAVFEELFTDQQLLHSAKVRQKQEADDAENLRLRTIARQGELFALGFVHDADTGEFNHPFGNQEQVTPAILQTEPEQWAQLINKITTDINAEAKKRIEADAEKQRLGYQLSMRILTIQRLGFYPSEEDLARGGEGGVQQYVQKPWGFTFAGSNLDLDETAWGNVLQTNVDLINDADKEDKRKKAEEVARLLKIRNGIIDERLAALGGIGYVRDGAYIKHPQFFGPTQAVDNIADKTSEQFITLVKELTVTIANHAKKHREDQEETAAAEKAEHEANASDKEKIILIESQLNELHTALLKAEFKSKKNKVYFANLTDEVGKLLNGINRTYKLLKF